ncbi:MAG: glycosyltransferase family 4 protein [Calditrichia bacterium]
MKRLLMITTNYPPSASIGTQRVLRICKYLDPKTWDISILTLKEKYYPGDGTVSTEGREFLNRLTVYRTGKMDLVFFLINLRDKLRGKTKNSSGGAAKPKVHNRAQQNLKEGKKIGLWQRMKDIFTDLMQFPDKNMNWFPLAVWRGWRVIRKQKIDVIYSSSPPHSLHVISATLKMITGKKLVVDFRDPWARSPWHDEERDLNGFEKWKHNRIIGLERWVVKKADEVILITKEMCDDYVAHYPEMDAGKFKLFYNGYDPENVELMAPDVKLNGNGKSEDAPVTFLHAGSLYRYRNPMPILQAVKNLLNRGEIDRDKIRFHFIGGITSDQIHIKDWVVEQEIDDIVKFVPPVSYKEAIAHMAKSEVLIILQPVTKLQLPGKFYDYLCLQKPILAVGETGGATNTAVGERFGKFVDYNRVGEIEEGIRLLYTNPHHYDNSISEHRGEFDMSNAIAHFDNIISN